MVGRRCRIFFALAMLYAPVRGFVDLWEDTASPRPFGPLPCGPLVVLGRKTRGPLTRHRKTCYNPAMNSAALTRARFAARLTQVTLSQRSGVAQSTISNLESGKQTASDQTIFALARILRVDPLKLRDELRGDVPQEAA